MLPYFQTLLLKLKDMSNFYKPYMGHKLPQPPLMPIRPVLPMVGAAHREVLALGDLIIIGDVVKDNAEPLIVNFKAQMVTMLPLARIYILMRLSDTYR
ncbi:hypothetical protein Hanom_Chr15g01365811 [Helianthus anomalus]